LENLGDGDGGDDDDVSRTCKSASIRESMKASGTDSLGYFELKQHNRWFDEESSKFLDQRTQAKLQ